MRSQPFRHLTVFGVPLEFVFNLAERSLDARSHIHCCTCLVLHLRLRRRIRFNPYVANTCTSPHTEPDSDTHAHSYAHTAPNSSSVGASHAVRRRSMACRNGHRRGPLFQRAAEWLLLGTTEGIGRLDKRHHHERISQLYGGAVIGDGARMSSGWHSVAVANYHRGGRMLR